MAVDDKPASVPLVEQLRSVPRDAVLRIDTPNALGCMDTRSIPVGRLCHEAVERIEHAAAITGIRHGDVFTSIQADHLVHDLEYAVLARSQGLPGSAEKLDAAKQAMRSALGVAIFLEGEHGE